MVIKTNLLRGKKKHVQPIMVVSMKKKQHISKNINKIKIQKKKKNTKHKEKIKIQKQQYQKIKVICVCRSIVPRNHLKRQVETDKHRDFIRENKNNNDDEKDNDKEKNKNETKI